MHSSNISAALTSTNNNITTSNNNPNRKSYKPNLTPHQQYTNVNGKNASLNDINNVYNNATVASHIPQPTAHTNNAYQQYNHPILNTTSQQSQPTTSSTSSPRHTLLTAPLLLNGNGKSSNPVSYSALPHGILINTNNNNSNLNSHHGSTAGHHMHSAHHHPHHHLLTSGNSGSAPAIDLMSTMMSSKGMFRFLFLFT